MPDTRKIRYVGPHDEVEIQPAHLVATWTVKQGHQVELPDDVAKSLLQQVDMWEAVKESKGGD